MIITFSGKKQSGKNTSANLLLGNTLTKIGCCKQVEFNHDGTISISDIFGDEAYAGQLLYERKIVITKDGPIDVSEVISRVVDRYIKIYSFADILKQTVCIDILGLTKEQCFGTDEQKNSTTHLMWENMPGVVDEDTALGLAAVCNSPVKGKKVDGRLGEYYEKLSNGWILHKPGPMTAREVMQFVGTEIFRKMFDSVWANACIRQIQKDNPEVAVISDCRFPNEVIATQQAGGIVVRLTRNPFNDAHASETALDNYDKFDFVVDNQHMTVMEQHQYMYELLKKFGV